MCPKDSIQLLKKLAGCSLFPTHSISRFHCILYVQIYSLQDELWDLPQPMFSQYYL